MNFWSNFLEGTSGHTSGMSQNERRKINPHKHASSAHQKLMDLKGNTLKTPIDVLQLPYHDPQSQRYLKSGVFRQLQNQEACAKEDIAETGF